MFYASCLIHEFKSISSSLSTYTQPTKFPTSSPTPCAELLLQVDVLTDNYPKETSWTLTNLCTDQIQESVGLEALYTAKATEYSGTYCVPRARYTFEISDKLSDGICCGSYGDGQYEVMYDGNQVAFGGQFFKSDSTTFGSCGQAPTSPPTLPPTGFPTKFPTTTASCECLLLWYI